MFRYVCLRYPRGRVSPLKEIRVRHASRCTSNRSLVPTKSSTTRRTIMTNDLDTERCFELAKELTLEAGKIVKRGFEGEKLVESKDADWDLVTNYDRQIEELLINGLSKEFPDHKFIAEETVGASKEEPELTDAPTWFIDPIDGTVNFIHSFPQFCISVGLAIGKQVVLGIIYNPMNSELYTAKKGEGAFLNGQPIRSSKVTELKNALLAVEPSAARLSSKNRDIRYGRLEALIAASRGTRNVGSAALTMAYVARGILDCFQLDSLHSWDVAAGYLLVLEAGGTVIDTKGGPYNLMKPNTIAAGTEALAQEIAKLIIDTDLKIQRKRLQRT